MAESTAQDVLLVPDENGLYDLDIDPETGNIKSTYGMDSTITTCLFTNRRAPASVIPIAQNRQGWAGDIQTADIQQYLGSTLFAYERFRITQNLLNEVKLAVQDALSFLIEDQIADSIDVTVREDTTGIYIDISIKWDSNTTSQYTQLWRNTEVQTYAD